MDERSFADDWYAEDPLVTAARSRGADLVPTVPAPAACAVLRSLATALQAAAVVQAGADSGITGLYLLDGMDDAGILTSIEAHPDADRAARETFRMARAGSRVRSITGDPLDVTSRLADGAYDMVVVGDGAGDAGVFLAEARRLLRPGGAAIFLRAFGPGSLVIDSTIRDETTLARRHFLNEVAEDPTLTSTLLAVDGGLLIVQVPRD